jgi:hypothetical protein
MLSFNKLLRKRKKKKNLKANGKENMKDRSRLRRIFSS